MGGQFTKFIVTVFVKGQSTSIDTLTFPLVQDKKMSVGRAQESDVVIADPKISRKHLFFWVDESGKLWVEDVGSTRGSRLGDHALLPNQPYFYLEGSRVLLGGGGIGIEIRRVLEPSFEDEELGSINSINFDLPPDVPYSERVVVPDPIEDPIAAAPPEPAESHTGTIIPPEEEASIAAAFPSVQVAPPAVPVVNRPKVVRAAPPAPEPEPELHPDEEDDKTHHAPPPPPVKPQKVQPKAPKPLAPALEPSITRAAPPIPEPFVPVFRSGVAAAVPAARTEPTAPVPPVPAPVQPAPVIPSIDLTALTEAAATLQSSEEELRGSIADLGEQLDRLSAAQAKAEEEIDRIEADVLNSVQKKSVVLDEVEALREEREALSKRLSEEKDAHAKKLQAEITAHNKKVEEAQHLLKNTQWEVNRLQTELEEIQTQKDQLSKTVKDMKSQQSQLEVTIRSLEPKEETLRKAVELLEKHQPEVEKLQQTLSEAQWELKKSQSELDAVKSQKKEIHDSVQALESKRRELEGTIEALTPQHDALKSAVELLDKQRTECLEKTVLAKSNWDATIKKVQDASRAEAEKIHQQGLAEGKKAIDAAERKAQDIIEKATTQAQRFVTEATEETRNARQRAAHEMDAEKKRHNDEMAKARLRETKAIEAMVSTAKDQIEFMREAHAVKIQKELEIAWTVKLSDFGMSPEKRQICLSQIEGVVKRVVMEDDSQLEENIKGVLKHKSGTGRKARRFWLQAGIGTGIAATLSLVLYLNPKLLDYLKPTEVREPSSADTYVAKLMKERAEKPKYTPETTEDFKASYVDNIIFTTDFLKIYQDKDYQEKWVVELNRYFLNHLGLREESIVEFIRLEQKLLKELEELRESIRVEDPEEGIQAMREVESVTHQQFRSLVKTQAKWSRFLDFQKKFFEQRTQ